MVKTSASHDGNTDSNPVAGAPSYSSSYATDVNEQFFCSLALSLSLSDRVF